ncbi:MAG: hypothetical protein KDI09_19480, partial [Halioglobus sp.]|nr:hypothetical protein [Halioglobus sp.]
FKRIRRGESEAGEDAGADESEPPERRAGTPGRVRAAPGVAPQSSPAEGPPASAPAPNPQAVRPQEATLNEDSVSVPTAPVEAGAWWAYYTGEIRLASGDFFGVPDVRFNWAYAHRRPMPEEIRLVVSLHDLKDGESALSPFAPSELGDLEVRVQDAGVLDERWREGWFPGGGRPVDASGRIVATLEFLQKRYALDLEARGIVIAGEGMGGTGAFVQALTLSDSWRNKIAYVSARGGTGSPRAEANRLGTLYPQLPKDTKANSSLWDSMDFSVRLPVDPLARGVHYRHMFSTDDATISGSGGASALAWVNLLEDHAIGGAASWLKGGDALYERGVRLPDLSRFETPEQDVSLQWAHPAFTRSSGNYPQSAKDRVDVKRFPRGHYNMGLTWDYRGIVDTPHELVFPIRYQRRTGLGKDIPDQPERITVNITPRRVRSFVLEEGSVYQWSWDGGKRSGTAVAKDDTLTVGAVPLVSGDGYKRLKIYR